MVSTIYTVMGDGGGGRGEDITEVQPSLLDSSNHSNTQQPTYTQAVTNNVHIKHYTCTNDRHTHKHATVAMHTSFT